MRTFQHCLRGLKSNTPPPSCWPSLMVLLQFSVALPKTSGGIEEIDSTPCPQRFWLLLRWRYGYNLYSFLVCLCTIGNFHMLSGGLVGFCCVSPWFVLCLCTHSALFLCCVSWLRLLYLPNRFPRIFCQWCKGCNGGTSSWPLSIWYLMYLGMNRTNKKNIVFKL